MNKIIAGNWKNNGNIEFIKNYFDFFLKNKNSNNQIILFPLYLYISQVHSYKVEKNFSVGGQRINSDGGSTHTSGTTSEMFLDNGCDYILIGHSEIRNLSDQYTYSAANDLYNSNGLQAIFCVGEDEDSKKSGNTCDVLEKQLEDLCCKDNYPVISSEKAIIAYEPVWAIGTGAVASPCDIAAMHNVIASVLAQRYGTNNVPPILYGGSVNADNASSLFSIPLVSGALVGGASLCVDAFAAICAAARDAALTSVDL